MSLISQVHSDSGQAFPAPRASADGYRRVAIISGQTAEAAGLWWGGVADRHWPGASAPAAQPCTIGDLLARTDVLEAVCTCDTAVVIPSPDDGESAIKQCGAMLVEHAVAAVVSLPACHAHLARSLQAAGVAVHHEGRGEATLAALVAGMSQRQQVVRELEVELRSRRAAQKQVHSFVSKVDSELLLAAKLQRELMRADDFHVPGLEVSAVYRPAWYVSGDIYRMLRVDEHHAGFMLADAMGHGISAAMYGMIMANGLSFKDVKPGSYRLVEPADALGRINGLLMNEDSDVTRFASAVCGLIDLRAGVVRVASAGHPTVRILGGKPASVESTGPVLGVFADAEIGQVERRLAPGQTLAVFTDGFEGAVGESNVLDFLNQTLEAAGGNVQQAAASVERYLDARPGSLTPDDDITLLLLQLTGR